MEAETKHIAPSPAVAYLFLVRLCSAQSDCHFRAAGLAERPRRNPN
jgi:hypothetical protein